MLYADGFASPQEGVPEGAELEADLELVTIRKASVPSTNSLAGAAIGKSFVKQRR